MSTPEGKVKDKVKRLLHKFGIYSHMPVMNGMGAPTLDFICCAWGYYLAIETKAPGEWPTDRQKITMKQISEMGGFVFVVRDAESLAQLEVFLEILEPCQKKNLRLGLRAVGPIETTTLSRKRSRKSAADSTSPLS
jgi:hypothetical protein